MTRSEFKARWESDEDGGGLTFDDVADCARAWGVASSPRTAPVNVILYQVLKEAGVDDADDYRPRAERDALWEEAST